MPESVEIRPVSRGKSTRYQVWLGFDFGDDGTVKLELDETFDDPMQAAARKRQILAEQKRAKKK